MAMLINDPRDGKVYYVDPNAGTKWWIPDPATFDAMGFDWNKIQTATNTGYLDGLTTVSKIGEIPADPNAPKPLEVQPGLEAEQWGKTFGETVASREAQNAIDREAQALQKYVADLNVGLQRDLANINNAADEKLAGINADLQRELQAGRITHEQYMQSKDLAQRECFAHFF